jgi:hypothetical protein
MVAQHWRARHFELNDESSATCEVHRRCVFAGRFVETKRLMVILALVVGGCEVAGSRAIPVEYDRILKMNPKARGSALRSLGVDERVDLYLVATESIHPPMLWLADEIAASAPPSAMDLTRVLDQPQSEHRRADLLYLASVVLCRDSTMRSSQELGRAVRAAASKVGAGELKERAQAAVDALGGSC